MTEGANNAGSPTSGTACRFCGSQVASGARKCASCGSWLIPFRQRPLGKALIVVIAILVALIVLFFASRAAMKKNVNNSFDKIEKNL